MDERASNTPRLDPKRRDEWIGVNFLLGEVDSLHQRGLILDDARQAIIDEYLARRDTIERTARFDAALKATREMSTVSPREALAWASRARELGPDRPEGWVAGIALLRKLKRFAEADDLNREAAAKFPDLVRKADPAVDRPVAPIDDRIAPEPRPIAVESLPELRLRAVPTPRAPRISWSKVAGEFLEDHWQKLISCLAVLLIVVSSTVGASLVLGPMLWSPAGKGILALVFTTMCAGFGVGLDRWGASRAGRMMLATTLFLVPINLMLVGDLGLLTRPSAFDVGLVVVDLLLLFGLSRWVVVALAIPSAMTFTSGYFGLAAFNAGASRGMPFAVGFPIFLIPSAIFLGAVSWLNARLRSKPGPSEEPTRLDFAYLEFGLLGFAFLAGVLRTGAVVLQLPPALYAIPAMLLAIAGVSTARAIGPLEKDRRRPLMFQQGGLVFSALAFALALARPPGVSALFSGNTLAVAVLGLALYATSLRATRLPAYLYAGFAALFLAYFGAFYFAKDLVHSVEEAARRAMGYDRPLPAAFKAINGLLFSVGLAGLARFFARRWSDDRLSRHCHYIGLPMSIAACVFSGLEPMAALICLGGYAILYAIGARLYSEPRLIYLACAAMAGSAFFGASMAGASAIGLRSMIASALGLAFWAIPKLPSMVRAGETYRRPLIHAARVMAAFAMVAATIASIRDGMISPLATVAFLLTATLALLNGREAPRTSIYLLALAALLGTWLGGSHLLIGNRPTSLMVYGLIIALFAIVALVAGEVAKVRSVESGSAYLKAMGLAVPVIVFLAWGFAGWERVVDLPVVLAFVVGSVGLLWLTRFRREPALVYSGLVGLAVAVGCFTGLIVPGVWPGMAIGWLAISTSGSGLVLWGAGELVRRRRSMFYSQPCFIIAGCLAVMASAVAVGGRLESAESYRLGVLAMVGGVACFGLIAASTGFVGAVSLAMFSAVGASSLAVLSQGFLVADSWRWLGMMVASEAILARVVAMLIRRFARDRGPDLSFPLNFGSLILLLGGLYLGYESPTSLVFVALASVLMMGAYPASGWLYLTLFAVGSAIYRGFLTGISREGLVAFVVIGAYGCWGLAVVLQRYRSMLGERFRMPGLEFDGPPVRTSFALGVLAVAMRSVAVFERPEAWADLPWLPWTLAGLCLLMLRFDPRRAWVHAAVGLTGLGFAEALSPAIQVRGWGLSAAMALAIGWSLAGRVMTRFEAQFRRRLGISEGSDASVIGEWSTVLTGLVGLAVLGLVILSSLWPLDGRLFGPFHPNGIGGWPDVMLALGLGGLYAILEGRKISADGRGIGLEVVGWLAVWWLGAAGSPLLGLTAIDRASYLPIATSAYLLGLVVLIDRITRRMAETVEDPSVEDRTALRKFTLWVGYGLGWATVYLSIFAEGGVALASLLMATAALGVLGLGWRRAGSAIQGGILWCLSLSVGLTWVDRKLGLTGLGSKPWLAGLGLVLGIFSLWTLAGRVRLRGTLKGGQPLDEDRIATALERVAIGAGGLAVALAWVDAPASAWLGSALLFAVSVFFAMVAWRKQADWPVYLAQGLLIASYFRARPGLDAPEWLDAVLLSMLAYLDLGLSELFGRWRLGHYARPTARFAMALPLVPIVQTWWGGRGDGADLFVLFATASFYALASGRLRSKFPAYASAVLVNAFMWVAWHRIGWRVVDHPQFFLIPVGFSSILFAEVNRRELRRSVVNGARNLGLVTVYASLAAPIWQAQSFGAWLALLILSMLGIFAGIGLRVQSFLWLGLAGFVADLVYQVGQIGMKHVVARWAVMLTLGVVLFLFVALNEKKKIVATMRAYYDEARGWE